MMAIAANSTGDGPRDPGRIAVRGGIGKRHGCGQGGDRWPTASAAAGTAGPIHSILAEARGRFKRWRGRSAALRAVAISAASQRIEAITNGRLVGLGCQRLPIVGDGRVVVSSRRQQSSQADVSRHKLTVDFEHFLKIGNRAGRFSQPFSQPAQGVAMPRLGLYGYCLLALGQGQVGATRREADLGQVNVRNRQSRIHLDRPPQIALRLPPAAPV